MSLKEQIETLKLDIAKAEEVEAAEVDEVEEGEDPATEETVIEEPKDEEPTEPKEPKEEKPEELDNAGHARLRREAAAAKKLADELRAENDALKAPKEEAPEETPNIMPELDSIIREHRQGRAEREFVQFESEVARSNPDYSAVSAEYAQALQGAIKIQNPRLSNIEIAEMTKEVMLQKAGAFARAGHANPVEELYHEAKELGFTGKSMVRGENKEPKPDMAKVAENRKRSAGMSGVSGKEDGVLTKKAVFEFSPIEWKNLPRAEKERLLTA